MINLKPYKNLFSSEWKSKYGAILMDEHLEKMENHLHQFQKGETLFEFPYFKDEIKEDLTLSFQPFLDALSLNDGNEIVKHLETIPIEHWLMVLGHD